MYKWLSLAFALLLFQAAAIAFELKAVDLEVQSLGAENIVDDRINVRPSVVFSLNDKLDLTTGISIRRKITDEKWLMGFYSRVSYKFNDKGTSRLSKLVKKYDGTDIGSPDKKSTASSDSSGPREIDESVVTPALADQNYLGEVVSQHYQQAVHWTRKAAEHGNSEAQYLLGLMCYGGAGGVKQDFVTAYMWLSLAIAQGNTDALPLRETISMKMNPAQIQQARQMAQGWCAAHPDTEINSSALLSTQGTNSDKTTASAQ